VSEQSKYYDRRAASWERHFGMALEYHAYLATAEPAKAQKWHDLEAKLPALDLLQEQRLGGHGRILRVLVYSGAWCGDCVRQGPILRRIADACGPQVEIRYIDRDASPELQDELRILGATRVPVVVFLSEDWFEVGRFGDRLLTVYRAKAVREVGPACDCGLVAPPTEQLAAEQEEWVRVFEQMLLMLRLSPMLRERHGD
jgi:thiol-disulfide isomerase/thioredoxin